MERAVDAPVAIAVSVEMSAIACSHLLEDQDSVVLCPGLVAQGGTRARLHRPPRNGLPWLSAQQTTAMTFSTTTSSSATASIWCATGTCPWSRNRYRYRAIPGIDRQQMLDAGHRADEQGVSPLPWHDRTLEHLAACGGTQLLLDEQVFGPVKQRLVGQRAQVLSWMRAASVVESRSHAPASVLGLPLHAEDLLPVRREQPRGPPWAVARCEPCRAIRATMHRVAAIELPQQLADVIATAVGQLQPLLVGDHGWGMLVAAAVVVVAAAIAG